MTIHLKLTQMKRTLIILSIAMLVAACGGGTEQKAQLTPEEQAEAYVEQMFEALNDGDAARFNSLNDEMKSWSKSLNDEDRAVCEQIVEEYQDDIFDAMLKNAQDQDFIRELKQ